MLLRTAILLLVMMATMNCFAQDACGSLFNEPTASKDFFLQISPVAEAHKFQDFHDQIDLIAEKLGLDMSAVKFGPSAPGVSPAYSFTSDAIATPMTFDKIPEGAALVTFGHEYTHAVFERFMRLNSRKWRPGVPRLAEVKEKQRALNAEFNSLSANRTLTEEQRDPRSKEILATLDSLNSESNQLFLKSKAIESFETAYHEFAADLLPTILRADPNVMRNAIAALSLSDTADAQLSLGWRSFEFPFDNNQNQIWLSQVERIYALSGRYNPYDLLAPLRSWFGSNLLKQGVNVAQQTDLLRKVFSALAKDHDNRVEAFMDDPSSLDPREINTTLEHSFALFQ